MIETESPIEKKLCCQKHYKRVTQITMQLRAGWIRRRGRCGGAKPGGEKHGFGEVNPLFVECHP